MGKILGGNVLQSLVVIDAFLVLSGAVLTSYVGVTGLIRRMTLDQCLPQFLLKQNRRRGTYHRIIIMFFLLSTSVLLVTRGNLLVLAGVYTISFLSVMSLFALGNILLKVNRKELKRNFRAGWITVLMGLLATLTGIVGNIIIDYKYILYFSLYFIPTVIVVGIVYSRIKILKSVVYIDNQILKKIGDMNNQLMEKIFIWRSVVVDKIMEITSQNVLVFTRGGNLPKLKQAFDYIVKNEDSKKVYVIYLLNEKNDEVARQIRSDLEVLDRAYPDLEVEFLCREGTFGPEAVREFSKEFSIPINNIFVGAPESKHSFDIQDLGGVRVIF
jgi:hypothetical protein